MARDGRGCLKAFAGLILIFVFHVPRLLYLLLLVSYAYVFNRYDNLTADPGEHLKRARKLLKKDNSRLLYAALEVRFALERMVHRELAFTERATERSLKEYDPVKKLRILHRIEEGTAHSHKIVFVNSETGARLDWAQYNPLDIDRVLEMQGRLGDLLHPKEGLRLGIRDDPWYIRTRAFLNEVEEYLRQVFEGNSPFFLFEGLDQFEVIREG